MGHDAISES